MDGHFGTILGVYREHLLTNNNDYLTSAWPRTKKAIDHAIATYDADRDGLMTGSYHNTLDCNVSGTSSWIGSLYIASLMAGEKMAAIMGDPATAASYKSLWQTAARNQNETLWDESSGHYIEQTENLRRAKVTLDGQVIPSTPKQNGVRLEIEFPNSVIIPTGGMLEVTIPFES